LCHATVHGGNPIRIQREPRALLQGGVVDGRHWKGRRVCVRGQTSGRADWARRGWLVVCTLWALWTLWTLCSPRCLSNDFFGGIQPPRRLLERFMRFAPAIGDNYHTNSNFYRSKTPTPESRRRTSLGRAAYCTTSPLLSSTRYWLLMIGFRP
jgi:hypothetical protein